MRRLIARLTVWVTCPKCNGRGWDSNGNACTGCGGNGDVWRS